MPKPILIVEDDPLQQQMLGTMILRKIGCESHKAHNGRQALDILQDDKNREIALVIMDLHMPVMGGLESLTIIKQTYPTLPVIMLSGSRDADEIVEAMKLGATDFINKPYEPERLQVTIKNTLKMSALSTEITRLRNEKDGTFKFENLIGFETDLSTSVHEARKAAGSDIQVLITGETGTGKEIFAKAIHGESARAGKSFIAVNCGAIPAQLVESTLFGHEKGSFTGAINKSLGKFREADGGTIFLDEIGDLPLDTQVKLLRVLQQKEVEPVGAGHPVPVNVRIISATHHDLKKAVAEGRFREDLYFRLNVLHLHIPPLRERKKDIPLLAQYFIRKICAQENIGFKSLTKDALDFLQNEKWSGNVRQLENALHRAIILSEGNIISEEHFSSDPQNSVTTAQLAISHENKSVITPFRADGSFKTPEEIESELIHIALTHHDGNITQAAKAIGMAKSTFYKKMKP